MTIRKKEEKAEVLKLMAMTQLFKEVEEKDEDNWHAPTAQSRYHDGSTPFILWLISVCFYLIRIDPSSAEQRTDCRPGVLIFESKINLFCRYSL